MLQHAQALAGGCCVCSAGQCTQLVKRQHGCELCGGNKALLAAGMAVDRTLYPRSGGAGSTCGSRAACQTHFK
jgi:hypothetical protein